jgi:(p)ppGpp synthase/HD superfamily hydrolase
MGKNEQSARDGWNRLAEAVGFALEVHTLQVRKGADTPYVSHLLGVASLVLEHGGDEEQAMAAMLHDAVEDLGAHLEPIIRERFGARVADIVLGCTDADALPKPPWRERKEAYIRHLEQAEADILLVSCADKFHNARAICTDIRTHGLAVFDRFKAGQDGTIWYYRALADAFMRLMPGALADELCDLVGKMESLASGADQMRHLVAAGATR